MLAMLVAGSILRLSVFNSSNGDYYLGINRYQKKNDKI